MLIGMQQCGAAAAACVIHGVVAGLEDRRRVENVPGCRRDDHFETDLTSHVCSAELLLMRQADNTRSAVDVSAAVPTGAGCGVLALYPERGHSWGLPINADWLFIKFPYLFQEQHSPRRIY
jgi:hypothetical protein